VPSAVGKKAGAAYKKRTFATTPGGCRSLMPFQPRLLTVNPIISFSSDFHDRIQKRKNTKTSQ
jgi:hypothetical protein